MTPQRLAIRFFLKDPASANADAMIPLFHRWIRERKLPGLLIDVADYKHVPDGPGVILIGHEADYGLDFSGGRPGLLTVRKRINGLDAAGAVLQTLDLAVRAAGAMEAEKLAKPLQFVNTTFELHLLDRLRAPNSEAGWQQIRAGIESALTLVTGPVQMSRVSADEREPLRVRVDLKQPAGWAAWGRALEGKAPVLAAAR